VALYGQTAVVGDSPAGNVGSGAAYVFVRSSSLWSQQAKLAASDGSPGNGFGSSVALYGSTVVVGAPFTPNDVGAAYVFVRSGRSWSQQARLTASDAAPNLYFGDRVALYGQTAVVGTPENRLTPGAAYVFVRSGTSWSQQANCPPPHPSPARVSAARWRSTGQHVVVGAFLVGGNVGAAYVFVRSGTSWSLQYTLTASDAALSDVFGGAVALYGSTAVIGADGKNYDTGAGYVFALPYPTISKLTPNAGPTTGGNTVTITGSGFAPGATVKFGSAGAALATTFVSATRLTVSAPAHAAGTADVFVTTTAGTSDQTDNDRYTYGP
jgi:hypothetical protein